MERSADRWARNHLSRAPPPSPRLIKRWGASPFCRTPLRAFSQGPKVERTKMERVRCPTFPERVSSAASDPGPLGSSSPLLFEISPTDRPSSERVSSSPPSSRFTRCISGSYQLFIAHAPREGGREASRTDPEVSPELRGAPRAPCGISVDGGRGRKVKSEIAGEEEREDQGEEGVEWE